MAARGENTQESRLNFDYTPKVQELRRKLLAFMAEHIQPSEHKWHAHVKSERRWEPVPVIEELKQKARSAGLWNLWRPKTHGGTLSNLEYAPLCEIMGRVTWAPEVFNCSAPDTGNMETLLKYGSPEHIRTWCEPLLEGNIRSAFLMTEPNVASSDATNIQTRMKREGDEYVINGTKWWSSGAGDPRCKIYIVMGKTDPDNASRHSQQSMVLVPAGAPGVKVKRSLSVFGYDDAPHGHMEIELRDVRVPVSNVLLGEGRGFEIAQGRLGPGRIHHCMRLIGQAEHALEMMCKRASQRVAFGRSIAEQGVTRERIAEARIMIDSARFMVLNAAWKMDTVGNKVAKKEIAMIKVLAPNMACQVIDWAMQVHGGGGVSQDFGLAYHYAHARTLRFADGPDEVHRNQIAKIELGEQTTLSEALSKTRAR
jgi:acyl-CoA dehydrogenase